MRGPADWQEAGRLAVSFTDVENGARSPELRAHRNWQPASLLIARLSTLRKAGKFILVEFAVAITILNQENTRSELLLGDVTALVSVKRRERTLISYAGHARTEFLRADHVISVGVEGAHLDRWCALGH